MLNAKCGVRAIVLPFALLIAACASAPSDAPIPTPPSASNESVGRVSSAVSVSPLPADPGMVFDEPPVMSNLAIPTSQDRPQLTFDGTKYIYTWFDPHSGAVVGKAIPESGAVSEQRILFSSSPPPRVRFGGIRSASSAIGTIVAWSAQDNMFGNTSGLKGACFLASGAVVPFDVPEGVEIYRSENGSYSLREPLIAVADAKSFHLLYYVTNIKGGVDFIYRRISNACQLEAPITIVADADPLTFDMSRLIAVSNGNAIFAKWIGTVKTDYGNTSKEFYFTLSITAPAPISVGEQSTQYGGWIHAVSPTPTGFNALVGQATTMNTAALDEKGDVISTGANIPWGYISKAVSTADPAVFAAITSDWNGENPCLRLVSPAGEIGGCSAIVFPPDRNDSIYSFGTNGLVYGKTTLVEVQPGNDYWAVSGKVSRYPQNDLSAPESLRVTTAGVNEEAPIVATDGDEYLIAWRDTRLSANGVESNSIFAQRLDAQGKAIDAPIVVSTTPTQRTAPALMFDGKKYVVGWTEYTDPPTGTPRIKIALIAPNGPLAIEKKIDIWEPGSISGGDDWIYRLAMASDGINRILAWTTTSGETLGIFGMRISLADDTLVDPKPSLLMRGVGYNFPAFPQLAFGGKRTLLTWMDMSYLSASVAAGFIEPGKLELSGPSFSLLDTGAYLNSMNVVASDSDTYFVTVEQLASLKGGFGIRGAYINGDGNVVGYNSAGKWVEGDPSATIAIASKSANAEGVSIAYAKDKANFVAVWNNLNGTSRDVYGAWIDPRDGRVRDRDGVPIAARSNVLESAPVAAFRKDGKGIVVYQEFIESIGASRLRIRAIDSGKLMGETCATNNECGTRECVGGVCCESACNEGCGVCNVTPGTCTPKPKGAPCGKANLLACNGESLSCATVCKTNDDCVSHKCVNGACETPTVRCVDDSHLSDESGNITDCGDYKCRANACRHPCGEVSDCRDGLVCNFEGECVAPPPLPNAPDGCMTSGVSNGKASGASVFIGGLMFVAGALARRRAARAKEEGR